MIGNSPQPCQGIGTMTALTIGGIPGLLMIGIGGIVVIAEVTVHAFGRGPGIDAVFMTIGTGGGFMFSFQRECRMIGYCAQPCQGVGAVAIFTIGGITGLFMVGIGGIVVFVEVAIDAIGRGAEVNAVLVTIGASGGFMFPF